MAITKLSIKDPSEEEEQLRQNDAIKASRENQGLTQSKITSNYEYEGPNFSGAFK